MRRARACFVVVLACGLGGSALGCEPRLEDGQFSCDPLASHACPGDMICAVYGNGHRCFNPGAWRCGNGILEANEQCDGEDFGGLDCADHDGRPEPARCSSVCTVVCCGNGRIEGNGEGAETCDDGNAESRDGCSSACEVEVPRWEAYADGIEQGRIYHRMVYFPPLQRVVLVGGLRAGDPAQRPLGGTFGYDGTRWTRLAVGEEPPARWLHALSYDARRERLVLHGGVGVNGDRLGDTWEFDGAGWSEVTGPGPGPRYEHAMAYDVQRQVTVLTGGVASDSPRQHYADTWELDGVTWVDRTAAVGASPPVGGHSLTYDAARGQAVLMGGSVMSGTGLVGSLDTLWRYDGATWTDSGVLTPGRLAAAVYDVQGQRVLVTGEATGVPGAWELFAWDGATFAAQPSYASPSSLWGYDLAYDPVRQRVVLFGGAQRDLGNNVYGSGLTWEFDGAGWMDTAPFFGPKVPNQLVSVARDPRSQCLLLVTSEAPVETWSFCADDLGWRPLAVDGPPGPLMGAPLVFDTVQERFVLFGAPDGATGRDDATWAFDGEGWERLTVGEPPRVNSRCARMVYDEVRQRAFLVGVELDAQGAPNGQMGTYALGGGQWQPLGSGAPPVATPGRPCPEAMMTYDASAGEPVLVGNQLSEAGARLGTGTWAHDGEAWRALTTTTSLEYSRANFAALAFDATTQRPILFQRADDATLQTWELRGRSWVETTPAAGPLAAQAPPYLAYDADRQAALLILPQGVGQLMGAKWTFDVWEYQYASAAAPE